MLETRYSRMERVLRNNLSIDHIEIENQSALHAGHYSGDGETHWRLLVVAKDFTGVPRVKRHQMVNDLLKGEFELGLHALSLQLFDPLEWGRKNIS